MTESQDTTGKILSDEELDGIKERWQKASDPDLNVRHGSKVVAELVLYDIPALLADHQARKEREEKVRELLYEIRNDGCSDGGCTCCNGAARKAQKALSLLSK